MNGVPIGVWVAMACVILPCVLWGSPLGWASAFKRWRSRRTSLPDITVASAAAAKVAADMQAMAQPTLTLIPAAAPAFSKLGGAPDLPSGLLWPAGLRGPRTFLVQLDLNDTGRRGGPDWLPTRGRLYAFLDEARTGFADHVQVLYSSDTSASSMEACTKKGVLGFPERRVEFERFTSVPNLDWMGIDSRTLRGADRRVWEDVARLADAPRDDTHQHRIGGYPNEIQETRMPLECEHLARGLPLPVWGAHIAPDIQEALSSWRLLLQIDSDRALRMNWGDGGRLYIFVRQAQARAGDFSETVTLFQTY